MRVSLSLARKKAVDDKISAQKSPADAFRPGDPLSELSSVFDQPQPDAHYAVVETAADPLTLIRHPANKAVYSLAADCFPFFRTNYNLLLQKQPTLHQKLHGELRIYVHEDATRSVFGLSVRGTLRRVRELRLFRESF